MRGVPDLLCSRCSPRSVSDPPEPRKSISWSLLRASRVPPDLTLCYEVLPPSARPLGFTSHEATAAFREFGGIYKMCPGLYRREIGR